MGPQMNLGKVYGWSKFKKLASNEIKFSLNFEKGRIFFLIRELSLIYNLYKKKQIFSIEITDGWEAP